jgi:hypothetical protein
MSPYLISDADLARLRRARVTVAEASDAHAASILADYLKARSDGDSDLMGLIRDNAAAIDPQLVDEIDGFDYLAAA